MDSFAPCPLCGSTDVYFEGDNGVECGKCSLHLPPKETDEETTKAWNKRTERRRGERYPFNPSTPMVFK